MTNETKIDPRYFISGFILGATATFGAYQIVKLGVDWAREGIRTVRAKKNSK